MSETAIEWAKRKIHEAFKGVKPIKGWLARDTVREDYPLRCGDCDRAHILDCSIPSDIWNQIARPEKVLCPVCIDIRLQIAELRCDEAEFHYGGTALNGKLYAESHGDVAHLRARVAALEADKVRLVAALERSINDYVNWRSCLTAYYETGSTSHAVAAERRLDDAMKSARAELNAMKGGGDDG